MSTLRAAARAPLALLAVFGLALAACAGDRCGRPCASPCATPCAPAAAAAPVPAPSVDARPTSCSVFECFRFVNHAKDPVEVVYALCDDEAGTRCTHFGRFVVAAGESCAHVPDPKRGACSMRVQVLDPTWAVSRPLSCPAAAAGAACACLRTVQVHYYGRVLQAHAELVPHGGGPCAKLPVQHDPAAPPFPAELQMPCSAACGE